MRKKLVAILSIALMLLAFASCTNDSSSRLPDEEAGAIATKIDPVQLINDALEGKIDRATVTFSQAKAAATFIATVEFDNATYNGLTISTGRLSYTFNGELSDSGYFRASSYRITTEQELSVVDESAVPVTIEIPETTTASTGSSVTARVTTDAEGKVEVEMTRVSISLPSSGAEVTVGGNDVTESIPSKPEPEEPDVSYVTITLKIADESTTASVVKGSTYTFSAPSDDLVPEGEAFISWSDAKDTEYLVGSTITASSDMTFTANLVGNTVYARVGEDEYASLKLALEAVKGKNLDGEPITIELLRSIEKGEGYSFAEGSFNITLDLRGNTYTFHGPSVGSTGTETQGFQILQGNNVEIKNGRLAIADVVDPDARFWMVIQNYSNLTLDNVIVDGTNLLSSGSYTLSNNCGYIYLKGNTQIISKQGDIAFDVCYFASYPYVHVTIEDETVRIDGEVEYLTSSREGFEENTSLTIPSGYESKIQLTAGSEDGREWVDNGNGTKSFMMPAEEGTIV